MMRDQPTVIAFITDEMPDEARAAARAIEHYAQSRRLAWRLLRISTRRRSRVGPGAIWVAPILHSQIIDYMAGMNIVGLYDTNHSKHFSGAIASRLDQASFGVVAADHFFACGYRRCCCLVTPIDRLEQRNAGFRARCQEHGLTVQTFDLTGPEDQRLFDWLALKGEPAGLYLPVDGAASWWRRCLLDKGFHIPQQVGLIGGENDPVYGYLEAPALTTVDMPWFAMGTNAARMIEHLLNGEVLPPPFVVAPLNVIRRESTVDFTTGDPLVDAAKQWLADNLHASQPVAELATHLNLPRRTLTHEFARITGTTIKKFHTTCRLQHAQELLHQASDKLTINEIAQQSGFTSSAVFGQVFRRETGQTPTAWRREHL